MSAQRRPSPGQSTTSRSQSPGSCAHVPSSEAFERDAAELPAELTTLEGDARGIAATAHLPEPSPSAGPRNLAEWASRSHAELFVARSQIDTQRERISREANELASMLLGEATYGSTVAQALQRVRAIA